MNTTKQLRDLIESIEQNPELILNMPSLALELYRESKYLMAYEWDLESDFIEMVELYSNGVPKVSSEIVDLSDWVQKAANAACSLEMDETTFHTLDDNTEGSIECLVGIACEAVVAVWFDSSTPSNFRGGLSQEDAEKFDECLVAAIKTREKVETRQFEFITKWIKDNN